jgi:hypothetical protein
MHSIGGFLSAHARAVLNLESIFGALVTLGIVAVACRRRNPGAETPMAQPASRWVSWVGLPAIVALVPLAFWRSLQVGLLSDDFILVSYGNEFTSPDLGQAFKTGGGDGFFRPVQYLEWIGLARLAGWHAESWHLVSWFFHAAIALLVYALARRLRLPAWESLFAAGLFVVLGSRPEAVVWITGLNGEMIVTILMLCALLLFVRSLEMQGGAAMAALIASWTAMVAGILSNEIGYIFPLLLVLWLASQGSTPMETIRRRFSALIPFFGAAALLFAYRWMLFGGIGGYRDPRSNTPQAMHVGLATLHALFGRLWGVLYFPINWTTAPNLAVVVLGMSYVAALLSLAMAGRGRQGPVLCKEMLFPVGFIMVAALPPLHLLMIGSHEVASPLPAIRRILPVPGRGGPRAFGASQGRRDGGCAGVSFRRAAAQYRTMAVRLGENRKLPAGPPPSVSVVPPKESARRIFRRPWAESISSRMVFRDV